jgi:hypothetical protein
MTRRREYDKRVFVGISMEAELRNILQDSKLNVAEITSAGAYYAICGLHYKHQISDDLWERFNRYFKAHPEGKRLIEQVDPSQMKLALDTSAPPEPERWYRVYDRAENRMIKMLKSEYDLNPHYWGEFEDLGPVVK